MPLKKSKFKIISKLNDVLKLVITYIFHIYAYFEGLFQLNDTTLQINIINGIMILGETSF